MKKTLSIACSALALTLAMSTVAEARDGFYLAGRGGAAWNNFNSKKDSVTKDKKTKLDHVPMFSGALGYKYKYFRGEVEYIWRDDAEEKIEDMGIYIGDMTLKSESFMFNAYIDFLPNYWISPYIGGGVGFSKIELTHKEDGADGQSNTWKDTKFTWQMGAGLSIRINKCLNLDAGYRYYTLGKIENAEVNAHEWYGGIRFTF